MVATLGKTRIATGKLVLQFVGRRPRAAIIRAAVRRAQDF
jgi:hypothetical protein